jgi:ubiquinone/menaquinone biosynthesis C-methylase UbiE
MNTELKPVNVQVRKHASWYKRLAAYVTANSGAEYNAMLAARKQALLGRLHGSVLEIGAGTAPNLAYYSSDVRWLGVEPNPAMFPYAQREAQQLGMTIELRESEAERLPVLSSSMDAVVSTTVLCSVRDPRKTLEEILRVLKPGGQFMFIEHVAAPRNTRLRRLQTVIRPAWQIVTDGCHPDRETWAVIENAGFSHVEIEHFRLDVPVMGPHIAGFAIK